MTIPLFPNMQFKSDNFAFNQNFTKLSLKKSNILFQINNKNNYNPLYTALILNFIITQEFKCYIQLIQ
jgi:hypothetical protein